MVTFNDLSANRQANAGSLVFVTGMETLKDSKNAIRILLVEANAIVLYAYVAEKRGG